MKNLADASFFTLRASCRETAQSSADRIRETRCGISPRVAALVSGMIGRVINEDYSCESFPLRILTKIVSHMSQGG